MGLFVKENTIPNLTVVEDFNLEKYLGTWYDIAHLTYKWQPTTQTNTTPTYSLREDGLVKVYNKGFNTETGKWESATGKAKPAGDVTEGKLLVSFFGPFYTPYNVSAVDDDYQYALVIGRNTDYMWILSRTTTIPEDIKSKYLEMAQNFGFNTDDLVWTVHDKVEE